MIFELKRKKDKELELMYEKAMNELDSFYKLNWKRNTPKIILLKNRKEIDTFNNKETPDWMVGWAEGNNIYLLDRKNYEKESSHKYSKETYFRLLKHELSHLFFEIVSGANTRNQFIWLNEGVAGCLSEQYKEKNKPQKFEKFLAQYSNWKGDAYNESTYAVKSLIDNLGDEKLLSLIKSLSSVKSKEDFEMLFKEIYGEKPSYEFFNSLIQKTIKND